MNPDGVFHPKLYLFENNPMEWECIIGSPNFTKSAFERNSEIAILISNKDIGSNDVYIEIKRTIDDYWKDAKTLTKDFLDEYERVSKRKTPLLEKISGHYDGLDKPLKKSGDGFDWRLFGSMIPARDFKSAIKDNNKHISQALDFIPYTGEITKTDYGGIHPSPQKKKKEIHGMEELLF